MSDFDVAWPAPQVAAWLVHEFPELAPKFTNKAGKHMVKYSKGDLIAICGEADGRALYNEIHPNALSQACGRAPVQKLGTIISGGKSVERPTTLFVYRENEVAKMAKLYTQNLQYSNNTNTYLPVMALSSQMFGSGKTLLGGHFLWKLRDSVHKQRNGVKEEDSISLVGLPEKGLNLLLNSIYVYVDMRDCKSFEKIDMVLRNQTLPVIFDTFQRAKDPSYWTPWPVPKALADLDLDQLKSKWSEKEDENLTFLKTLVELEKDTSVPLFIHFDEVDALLECEPRVESLSRDAVQRYYDVWNVFTPIMRQTYCSLFCSGRSSLLGSIGLQLYRGINIYPTDGRTEQILIPNFAVKHIVTMLTGSKIKFATLDAKKKLARLIHKRTLGVARLVVYGIVFCENHFETEECYVEDVKADLLGGEFIKFGCSTGGGKDFDPFMSLPQEMHAFYYKLVRFAALQIPLDMNATISNPSFFGLSDTVPVITQDILRVYNLYIGKSGDSWIIVVPPVVLDAISQRHITEAIPISFWILHQQPLATDDTFGPALEQVTTDRLLKRFETATPTKADNKWHDLLPFLKGSIFGEEMAAPLAHWWWPKMVQAEQKAKPRHEYTDKKQFDEKVDEFFAKFNADDIVVNVVDFPYLIQKARANVLYIPLAKSRSIAAFILGTTGNSLHIQYKASIKKQVTLDTIAEEAKKADNWIARGTKATFLVVAMNVSEGVQAHKAAKAVVYYGVTLAVRFKPGANLGKYEVPSHIDIVVLLEEGVNMLITKQTADLIRKGEQSPEPWIRTSSFFEEGLTTKTTTETNMSDV